MADWGNPTVRRRELGRRLREARERARRSIEEAAQALHCHPSKISRLENATRGPNVSDVRALCDLYEIDEQERNELIDLARKAREPAWWQPYTEVATRSSTYLGLEAAATYVRHYETIRVPGLLQTPNYTRALLRRVIPRFDVEAIEQYVETRLARKQLLLRQDPIRYWAIVDEAVLRRRVGDTSVMREQLAHILDLVSLPNVTFQMVPFDVGAHPGMEGPFVILSFSDPVLRDVVHVEGRSGMLFLDSDGDLAGYSDDFDNLRALAEAPDSTAQRLEQILRDLGPGKPVPVPRAETKVTRQSS